jgi:hypothetical protein
MVINIKCIQYNILKKSLINKNPRYKPGTFLTGQESSTILKNIQIKMKLL